MSIENIKQKVERLIFNYLIKEDHIIENNSNIYNEELYYTFVDIPQPENINQIKKTKFLNDTLNLFMDIYKI